MELVILTFVLPNLFFLAIGLIYTCLCLSKDFNLSSFRPMHRTPGGKVGPQYWGNYGGRQNDISVVDKIQLPKCRAAQVQDPGDFEWDYGTKKSKK